MRNLSKVGRLCGRVLDYGSGKGYDADAFDTESYDPYYQPIMPEGKFDTIVCNFVLNVISSKVERQRVIRDIMSRLNPGGKAYFSVRSDKSNLNGYTKRGTWQGFITLDLPIITSKNGFTTYVYCAGDIEPISEGMIFHAYR